MTEKLREHLIRCEQAVQAAKPILGRHRFQTDIRTRTVIGFLTLVIEHQESILLLVMPDKPGSAAALFRPVVEGTYRALWINLPANEDEVAKFVNQEKIAPNFGELAETLDSAYGTGQLFSTFKTKAWNLLNSYAHGGMHQVARRFVETEVANNYSEEDLYETTSWSTVIVLLAMQLFLKRHGHTDSGCEIEALIPTYDLRMDGTEAGLNKPGE